MDYDVLIVGGGPAGLSAALTAAQSGLRVAVFEKSKEIGYPIHTSGGSWIEDLRALGVPEKFMSPVTEGLFVAPSQRAFFSYNKAFSCVLDVRGLYQYLAEIASHAGARIFIHSIVEGPLFTDGRVSGLVVRRHGEKQQLHALLVIDASGASCVVGRKAGLTQGFKRLGIGAEYDLFAPEWPAGRVAFLFGSHVAPSGYGWIFPHGDRRVRVGVGVISPDSSADPKVYLDRFVSGERLFKKELAGASRLEYHAGTIPSEPCLDRTVADGLLVAGDAGGLISILLGEGIRFAIDIGRMAGQVAAEAIKQGDVSATFLTRYEKRWKKKYQLNFRIGALINRRLATYSDKQWDEKIALLAGLDPLTVVDLLKGNFSYKFLMSMSRKAPHLLGRIAFDRIKALFKNT